MKNCLPKSLFIIVLLILPLWISAQESNRFTLLDIFDLEYISSPQISPDGKRILYVRNFKDIMTDKNLSNIWIVDFDGSNNRPITTGNQRDTNPLWVPGSEKIIYQSNKDGSSQLYLHWLSSRAEQKITNNKYSASSVEVSPDGSMIAFNRFVDRKKISVVQMPQKPEGAKWNDPPRYIDDLEFRSDGVSGFLKSGERQIFIMDINGGTPRQLTTEAWDHTGPTWSKDGKTIFFTSNRKENAELDPYNSEIYSLNISSGMITQLTDQQGPDARPVVSPDGNKLAYMGFKDEYQGYQVTEITVMNTDGSNKKVISSKFDRDPQQLSWSEKSDGLYFMYDDKGNTSIAFMDLKGKVTNLAKNVGGLSLGRPYTGGQFSVTKDGKYAYTSGSSYHPSELGVGENGRNKQITDVNSDVLGRKQLGKVEELTWKSSFDKREIQGWLIYPPDFDPNKKYPLILEIHGGPFAAYSSFFAAELQLYASAGYVVLYCNPRGSTSYGQEFGNLIHHNYPGEDYDDLMSGVDAVIEKGFIDTDNLMVTGGSGGGVLSSWIIGKTDRFRAAVIAKPVINWYSHILTADATASWYNHWFPGYPWEHQDQYMKRSPISLVGNVTTPAMLLTGENDYRTPMGESEQYYSALKLQGKEAALVRIPNASHGIANTPSNLVAKISAVLSWFEKYRTDNSKMDQTINDK